MDARTRSALSELLAAIGKKDRMCCEDGRVVAVELNPHEVSAYAGSLVQLQRDAYAIEAALIGDDRIPALRETEFELIAAGLRRLLESEHGRIIGALAFSLQGDVADIERLIVHPAHHRHGVGARLVQRVVLMAPSVVVSTGRDNTPARRLYEAAGFIHRKDREVLPGLTVSDYSLEPRSAQR